MQSPDACDAIDSRAAVQCGLDMRHAGSQMTLCTVRHAEQSDVSLSTRFDERAAAIWSRATRRTVRQSARTVVPTTQSGDLVATSGAAR